VRIPKTHFHPSEAFLTCTPCHTAAKAAELFCPGLEAFPLLLPPTHHPVHPSCPDQPSALLRKAGKQAEVPLGRLCTDPLLQTQKKGKDVS